MQTNSTTVADSEIKYDRTVREYAIYIAGEIIGYASCYSDAEQLRTAALAERRGH